jgi:hypothetical protein
MCHVAWTDQRIVAWGELATVGQSAGEVTTDRHCRAQVPRFPEGRDGSAAIVVPFPAPPSNRGYDSPAHGPRHLSPAVFGNERVCCEFS